MYTCYKRYIRKWDTYIYNLPSDLPNIVRKSTLAIKYLVRNLPLFYILYEKRRAPTGHRCLNRYSQQSIFCKLKEWSCKKI